MPTPGLSLVGFMDQFQAFHHLRGQCVADDPSDAAMGAEWVAAQTKLGAPIPNAGHPDIQPIPPSDMPYVHQLMSQPWVRQAFTGYGYQDFDFKMVEIEPLLAFQFHVENARSHHHCGTLSNPTVEDLLPIFLPQNQPKINELKPIVDLQQGAIIIKTRSTNLRYLGAAVNNMVQNGYETILAGVQLHVQLPFVQVVKYNDLYYLHNGFHRTYGAAISGATHVPCLIRDVPSPDAAGLCPEIPGQPWRTFPLRLLESTNPPTVGHFTRGAAYPVKLRSASRMIHISWAESALPDEYD